MIPLLHVLAAIASTEHVCVWLLPHACVHVRSGVKELSGHLLSSGKKFGILRCTCLDDYTKPDK